MTRATRPGSIQAAVRKAIQAVGGLECASDDLGLSASTLSYGTEVREDRPGGLGVNYLDRLARIDAAAALPVAQHFAELAGGVFQPITARAPNGADIAVISREFSDVLAKHAEAHSDASDNPADYTPQEAQVMIKELQELVEASLMMMAGMRQKAAT